MKEQHLEYIYEPFAETEEYRKLNSAIVARWLEVMRDNGARGIDRLLDIATGVGTMVTLFLDNLPKGWDTPSVVCLDMSEEALEQTRIRLGPSVSDLKLVHSTVQEMSMPDNSVDVAVWGNGIHYLNAQGQEEALRSIKRVVKPQGWFVFNSAFYQESRPPETSTFYRSQVRKAVEQLRSIGVHRQERTARPEASDFLPRSHYEELMQLVGFKIVEAKETASHMYRTAWEHISGFHQYAAGALHGYDPEAAADAMRKAVAPALEEHGTRDEHNIPYVQRNWLSIIAHA